MKLTNPEKLILTMLAQIHEKLGINDGVDTKLLQNAIYSDNTWALSAADNAEPIPHEVKEVQDILDMWSFMEETYERFSDADKEKVKTEADPFGAFVKFVGFDAHYDYKHLSVARFLIDDMGRFSRFKGRELNSTTSVETYRRMLNVFLPIRPSLVDGVKLSAEQIIEILKVKNSN